MQNERIYFKFLKFKKSIKLEKKSKSREGFTFLHINKGTVVLLQTLIF